MTCTPSPDVTCASQVDPAPYWVGYILMTILVILPVFIGWIVVMRGSR